MFAIPKHTYIKFFRKNLLTWKNNLEKHKSLINFKYYIKRMGLNILGRYEI